MVTSKSLIPPQRLHVARVTGWSTLTKQFTIADLDTVALTWPGFGIPSRMLIVLLLPAREAFASYK